VKEGGREGEKEGGRGECNLTAGAREGKREGGQERTCSTSLVSFTRLSVDLSVRSRALERMPRKTALRGITLAMIRIPEEGWEGGMERGGRV